MAIIVTGVVAIKINIVILTTLMKVEIEVLVAMGAGAGAGDMEGKEGEGPLDSSDIEFSEVVGFEMHRRSFFSALIH